MIPSVFKLKLFSAAQRPYFHMEITHGAFIWKLGKWGLKIIHLREASNTEQ